MVVAVVVRPQPPSLVIIRQFSTGQLWWLLWQVITVLHEYHTNPDPWEGSGTFPQPARPVQVNVSNGCLHPQLPLQQPRRILRLLVCYCLLLFVSFQCVFLQPAQVVTGATSLGIDIIVVETIMTIKRASGGGYRKWHTDRWTILQHRSHRSKVSILMHTVPI